MITVEGVHDMVSTIIKSMLGNDGPFRDEYSRGIHNGLELALAYIEERPTFFRDANKKHDPEDMKRYPEYFL